MEKLCKYPVVAVVLPMARVLLFSLDPHPLLIASVPRCRPKKDILFQSIVSSETFFFLVESLLIKAHAFFLQNDRLLEVSKVGSEVKEWILLEDWVSSMNITHFSSMDIRVVVH